MSIPSRLTPRLRSVRPLRSIISRPFYTTVLAKKQDEWPQRMPLGEYYERILNNPTPLPFDQKPEEPPNSADPEVLPEDKKPVLPPPDAPTPKKKPGRPRKTTTTSTESQASQGATPPTPAPPAATAQEKARIIFGTRLASPDDKATRLANKTSQSSYIAGVLVPPQPQEPANCCMSGCVNCVWDLYREDMEEWTAKKTEAEALLDSSASSGEVDSGGSEATLPTTPSGVKVGDAKIAKDLWDDNIFKNVPVGIREFMKQEKRLKERHEREGTSGG